MPYVHVPVRGTITIRECFRRILVESENKIALHDKDRTPVTCDEEWEVRLAEFDRNRLKAHLLEEVIELFSAPDYEHAVEEAADVLNLTMMYVENLRLSETDEPEEATPHKAPDGKT